jgi:hypothetical protein
VLAWDLDHIPILLRQLSEAMSDEVTSLSELEPIGAGSGVRQAFGFVGCPTPPENVECGAEHVEGDVAAKSQR